PAGANCTDGGIRVDVGTDTSGDAVLDTDEITSTGFVCVTAVAPLASGGLVYGTDSASYTSGNLYSIDVGTAEVTIIAPLAAPIGSITLDADGNLFGHNRNANTIVQIDTTTGALT